MPKPISICTGVHIYHSILVVIILCFCDGLWSTYVCISWIGTVIAAGGTEYSVIELCK